MHAKVQQLERSRRKEPDVETGGSVEAGPRIVSESCPFDMRAPEFLPRQPIPASSTVGSDSIPLLSAFTPAVCGGMNLTIPSVASTLANMVPTPPPAEGTLSTSRPDMPTSTRPVSSPFVVISTAASASWVSVFLLHPYGRWGHPSVQCLISPSYSLQWQLQRS